VEVETNKFEYSSLSFSKGKEVGEERECDFARKFKQGFWIHIHLASGSSSPFLWFKYNLFG
jgi:hypothetical protein